MLLTEECARSLKGPGLAISSVPGFECCRGKVRDIYTLPDSPTELLIVATDRVSVLDFVLPNLIEGKGEILTSLTRWWSDNLDVYDHIVTMDHAHMPPAFNQPCLMGRCMTVEKASVLPYEVIVRGYLCGAAYREYQGGRRDWMGTKLPSGLRQNVKLPRPLVTITTKNPNGHDQPIEFEAFREKVGDELAMEIGRKSLDLYGQASDIAWGSGLILADCKLEWGTLLHDNNGLVLVDEILTPDSARYWPVESYRIDAPVDSWDKDSLRYWYRENWDMNGRPPEMPYWQKADIKIRYELVRHRLMGDAAWDHK